MRALSGLSAVLGRSTKTAQSGATATAAQKAAALQKERTDRVLALLDAVKGSSSPDDLHRVGVLAANDEAYDNLKAAAATLGLILRDAIPPQLRTLREAMDGLVDIFGSLLTVAYAAGAIRASRRRSTKRRRR